jgi:hypothetical protein
VAPFFLLTTLLMMVLRGLRGRCPAGKYMDYAGSDMNDCKWWATVTETVITPCAHVTTQSSLLC